MSTKVAYIGIGDMGYPMAGHLAANGYDVSVFDVNRSRVDAWTKEYNGHGRTSAADAAAGAEFVFSSVSTEGQVLASTTEEDGAFHSMAPGGVYVDHSTTSAVLARDRAGGDRDSFDRALPGLKCYGKEVEYLGPSGAGQLAKMVSQIAIAGIVESLAEALHFAQRSGLDGKQVVDLLSRGPATSWWMVNRAGPMLEDRHDVGGPVRNMLKDYAMCLDEAERVGARLPVVELVHRFCEEMTAQGDSERDFTGLIKFLNDTAQG